MSTDVRGTGSWPKSLPELTADQTRVRDLFMARWLEELPSRYAMVERFNHGYAIPEAPVPGRTLEIGAGLGAHLAYEEHLDADYYAIDLRPELVDALHSAYPTVTAMVANVQETLPFADGFFNRILAIHVLEHLPDLPRALAEVDRVLAPGGEFVMVIPCEQGMCYALARRISAQRLFEREFKMSYDWLIRSEHVNVPWEIIKESKRLFDLKDTKYFPLRIPSINLNLAIGLTFAKR